MAGQMQTDTTGATPVMAAGSRGALGAITYERKQSYNPIRSSMTTTWYVVKLDGKRVGTIKQSGAGWRYYAKGKRVGGEWFLSLLQCKASLEAA